MKESSVALSTKGRIIKTTLDIISEEGFQNVTVRKIATRAGVNIAAVNYHFGSKDLVIDKALQYVTSQMKGVFALLREPGQPPQDRLDRFLRSYTDTLYKYPDIVKYMIDQKIHNCDAQVEYSAYLEEEGVPLLTRTFQELWPDDDEMASYIRTLQALSCISFPILMGESMQRISGLDLNDRNIRSKFIDLLITQTLS